MQIKMADTLKPELSQMSCGDFREFKEALKVLRILDDKLIYKLNTSVPTASFSHEVDAEKKCKELYAELLQANKTRENAIKHCIHEMSNNIRRIKEQKETDPDNYELMKKLNGEQTKLRLMHSELSVEEILKPQTMKVFNEKCWKVFKPPK